jgi:hypothetical protein
VSNISIPEIFVSYAWEKESESVIAKLEVACKNRGIMLIRDKTDIHFKGIISEYMKKLGQGKFVVLILSDKYLKSENCMFELLEIAKNGNFYSRIFPIVLESANFYKPIGRIKYISHWEKEIEELNSAMIGLKSQADLAGVRESIDLYTKIRATIAELTNIIRDMNSLSLEQHVTGNFDEILSLIDKDTTESFNETDPEELIQKDIDTNNKVKQYKVLPNLLKLSLPDSLYVADLSIDREEIIKKTWETTYKLKLKASDRKVVNAALSFIGKEYSRDWHIFNNKIITFNNPNNSTNPIRNIINASSTEQYSVDDFLSIKEEYHQIFVALLNACLREKLYKKEIEWIDRENLFRFKTGKIPNVKKMTWKSVKQATRTVIFEKWNKDKTAIVAFRHLAFKAQIIHFGSGWYICINPTWSLSVDGRNEYAYASTDISGLKRLENNSAVYNHFRFLSYCLSNELSDEDSYSLLNFVELSDIKTL